MEKKIIKTPVLLIAFNRPDTTENVFQKIREAQPQKLYVAVDGARASKPGENKLVEKVRQIVNNVDWKCDVKYRFLDNNVGCGFGPASAISWAFETEEQLIILEDDCVPALPFFSYCETLLNEYKDDTRVWLISGRSHHASYPMFKKYDYIFTYWGHTWGWATWKRCWKHFDIEMTDFPIFMDEGGFRNIFNNSRIVKHFKKNYTTYYNDSKLKTHAWDFQWVYTRLKNRGLCIIPSKNLIHNIGSIGTHSTTVSRAHTLPKNEDYVLLNNPKFILPILDYEEMHFRMHLKPKKSLISRIVRKLVKMFK